MLFNNLSNSRSGESHRHHCAVFGDFVLDFDRGCLQRNGTDVPLRPKSFEVLTYLVRHHGVLISKAELLDAVWPKVVVTEDSLIQCLIEIRKALGDCDKQMIVTVPRRGYLFDMDVNSAQTDVNSSDHKKSTWFSRHSPVGWSAGGALLLAILVAAGWMDLPDSGYIRTAADDSLKPTPNQSSALQHYEQGRFFYNRRGDGDLVRADLEYRKALAIDPGLAKAWVGLGALHRLKAWESELIDQEEYVGYLKHALELDPNNAEANMRMSNYHYFQGNTDKVVEHLAIALKYGQNDSLVLSMAAGDLMFQLRIDEALTLQRRAVELDPTSAVQHENLAVFYLYAGRFEDARNEYSLLMKLKPESKSLVAPYLFQAALSERDVLEAEQWSRLINEDSLDTLMASAMLANLTGNQAEVDKNIEMLVASHTSMADLKLAEYYAFIEDQEASFVWLNSMLSRIQENPNAFYACGLRAEAYYSPFLKSLKNDSKWLDWKREMTLIVPPSANINISALVQVD